jgi:signal peptidase
MAISALWLLFVVAVFVMPRCPPLVRPAVRPKIVELGLLVGFFGVASYIAAGLVAGFGLNPLYGSSLGIVRNILYTGCVLVGIETSRAWLASRIARRHMVLSIAGLTLVYTFIALPLGRIMNLGWNQTSMTYLASTCFPRLSENMLATLLALLAGPMASIGYRGLLEGFRWCSPLVPDLSWTAQALLGTLVPLTGFWLLYGLCGTDIKGKTRALGSRVRFHALRWALGSATVVALVWFSLGLFPIYPTLVGGASMSPALHAGDVAIIAQVPANEIQPDDIIEFTNGDIKVIHRVVDIVDEGDSVAFVTQGDANANSDAVPVPASHYDGKVLFALPKVGSVRVMLATK